MTVSKSRKTFLLVPLLVLTVGCTSLLPKAATQEGLTPQIKKRNEASVQYFEQQRDLAEYEGAKNLWEQQHDAKGCREGLEKLLARNPKHRDARLLMAEVLMIDDDPQGAYRHAKAALDLWPNDALVHFTMATTLDALGKTSDALGYYQRAAAMDPRNESFQVAYQTAREASREEVRDRHARPATPDDVAAGRATQASYTTASSPASSAVGRADFAAPAELTGSIAVAGDSAAELLRKGQAALAGGDGPTATDCFFQAMALQPENPQIPISAAAAALRANRADMAVELLTPAARQFPNAAAIHRMLGAAYYRSGDYPSSQVALQHALSLDKSSALSYLLMGYTLAKLGQKDAAEAHFRQARSLDPRYTATR